MEKTLQMVFENAGGNKVSINLPDPKDMLDLAQVQAAMQTIVDKNVFTSTGGDLLRVVDAKINTRDVVELV